MKTIFITFLLSVASFASNYPGIASYSTCASNPLIALGTAGQFDATDVRDPSCWYGRGKYWCLYVGLQNATPPYLVNIALAHATTPCGTWTKDGLVITTSGAPAWAAGAVFDPGVYYDAVADVLYIYPSGTTPESCFASACSCQIGLVTVGAGLDWTNAANYVWGGSKMLTGTASWDSGNVYTPTVVNTGVKFLMYFSSFSSSFQKLGVASASSPSGPFTEYQNNPIAGSAGHAVEISRGAFVPNLGTILFLNPENGISDGINPSFSPDLVNGAVPYTIESSVVMTDSQSWDSELFNQQGLVPLQDGTGRYLVIGNGQSTANCPSGCFVPGYDQTGMYYLTFNPLTPNVVTTGVVASGVAFASN